ncbi:MAG TPA: chemotaxis protein CheB [Burkholderiales bacterium]
MAEPASPAASPDALIPVVGIGASAGGLEPIGELLEALPVQTGMAFLVVQHLDPARASMLAEILGKKTSMPVVEVKAGMSIAPDHAYIIPPNTLLSLDGDALHLQPRPEGRHPSMPVDFLFQSLAAQRGHNAVGIVLSGTGSDGTRGLQAIKAAGGVTLAQEEASASFPGMPRSAVDAGCVDFIQTPREMGETLARLGRHPYLQVAGAKAGGEPSVAPAPAAPAEKAAVARVFRLLRTSSGVDFTHYKRATIDRRLARRMALHHLDDLASYVDLLQSDLAEQQALSEDLLIVVTSFFRDPGGLEALARLAFPALMAERSPKDPLRVWVPGCASGEEVYSIAISLLEFLGERSTATPIQIFGTDVSERAIERARAGIYPESIAAEVSPERLRRFFLKLDSRYQIAKSIREMCVFARHDVTRDPPFSRLDLVSCCNLLIYLDQAMQRRVLSLFHYALKPRGFLMLGPSESVGESADLFESMDKHYRIYARKAAASGHRGLLFDSEPAEPTARSDAAVAARGPVVLEAERIQREADRVLLERYAPPCVLIDEELNVLQFRGQTGPYLEHAPGPASLSLRKLAAPALVIALVRAMEEARKTGEPVRTGAVRLEAQGAVREIWLQVSPVHVAEAGLRGYLVAFEEAPSGRAGRAHSLWRGLLGWCRRLSAGAPAAEETESARLQRELTATRDYLQAAIEGHEAVKEELKSAHEELLSANEELQSTNEELQTAKEELESTNEELITTNEELTNRNREMASVNEALRGASDYADAIVQTTPSPLLVLDASLHVMNANSAFYQVFKTRPEHTEGRYLYELGDRDWDMAGLRDALTKVLSESQRVGNLEVRHSFKGLGEKILLLSAQRLRGGRNRPDMILLSIEDDTQRKRVEEQLAEANRNKDEFLAMLAHELRNPLAPMRLAAETMRTFGSADSTVTFGAAVIGRQVAHLSRLVDDLLDVSRINRGMIEVQKRPIALSEAVGAAIEISRPLIEEREHHLAVVEAPGAITVNGDLDRLAQVVSNLLNNAAKFTPKGGEIRLSTQLEGKDAVVKVRDNGNGIPAGLLPRVFDLFIQADASHGRGYGGMGIGLALARRLVDLHGGSIEAKSEGEGKGAEFVVRLPRCDAAPAEPPRPNPVVAEQATRAIYRVLVVDDNVDAAKTTQAFLQAQGHEVRCAFDGLSALGLAQEFKPQLVLLDIAMPGMDGYEVLRRLREQAGAAQPVVAVLTGYGSKAGRERMKQLGVDHYLVKPAEPQALLALIASLA